MALPFGRHRLLAAALSAVAFGLLHEAFVAATVAGVLYAVAQAHGRSVRAAVWAHATTNALIAVEALVKTL